MLNNAAVKCPACEQDVPESVKELHYFAANCLKPEVDDVGCFLDDLRDLTSYMEALMRLLCSVDDSSLDSDFLHDCLNFGWALASETRRRQALADDAWTIVEKRLYPDVAAAIAKASAA